MGAGLVGKKAFAGPVVRCEIFQPLDASPQVTQGVNLYLLALNAYLR